jgi:hypothetical protein
VPVPHEVRGVDRFTQFPRLPEVTHDWHCPPQPELQQTPSAAHVSPAPHWLAFVQLPPAHAPQVTFVPQLFLTVPHLPLHVVADESGEQPQTFAVPLPPHVLGEVQSALEQQPPLVETQSVVPGQFR